MRCFGSLAALALLGLCGCGKEPAGEKPGGVKPAGKEETPTATRLARHRYWRVPMTAREIDDLVARVVRSDGVLVIDANGEAQEYADEDAARFGSKKFGAGQRITFDVRKRPARPTREQVLADLAEKLDEAVSQPVRGQDD